jgi:hypothetical protein
MKKWMGLLLAVGIFLTATPNVDPVDAQITDGTNPDAVLGDLWIASPMYLYTQSKDTTLSIISGTAYSQATLTGISGVTTSISITMVLEKKVLWWWSSQQTWAQNFSGYSGTLSGNLGISSGTYRTRAVYVVYSGSNSETIEDISSEKSY